MRIQIDDDNQNWLNWGTLVVAWVKGTQQPPMTVRDLKQQWADYGVTGQIQGADNRGVSVVAYSDKPTDPIIIEIPSVIMYKAKFGACTGGGPYPLPLFYDIAYGGAARANLSAQESEDFAYRRIGEYSVNECC